MGLTAGIIGGVISGAGSIISGSMAAGASKDAANAQVQASQAAQAYIAQQNALTQGNLAPFLGTGIAANTELSTLLGLGGTPGGGALSPANDPAWQNYVASGGYTGGPTGDTTTQQGQRRTIYANEANTAGINSNDPNYGSLLKQFTGKDLQNSPGYQFTLGQGTQAITNAAAAGQIPGGVNSGAFNKALVDYNQGLAGTYFNQAFNQDAANKSFTLGALTGVSGAGQNAAVQQGGFGQNAAAGISGLTVGAGNATAAGIVGGSNATSAGINNAITGYQQAQTLRSVFGGGSSAGNPPDATGLGQAFDPNTGGAYG